MTTSDLAWADLPQAARDAAYNNAAAVADSAARIAAWTQASAARRAEAPAHLDLAYGPKPRNKWDLFPGQADAPCLVFIHGGYWLRNSREVFTCMADGVRAHRWSAALPGYTLAPDATLPEIVAEMRAAFDWLAAHRAAHRMTGPVIVSGWSAGGHLATLMLDHPLVSAGVAISGVFDLGRLRDTAYQATLRLTPEDCQTLSPQRLPVCAKPLAIAYGTAELPALVANSCDYHAKRTDTGAPGPLIPVAGCNHFDILESLRAPDGLLTRVLLETVAGLREPNPIS
jgi:acetyl esterase/lipase